MGRVKPVEPVEAPTQAHVIAAILAASRWTGADPVRVEKGDGLAGNSPDEGRALVRARAYAAFALRAVFEGFDTGQIAKQVGGRGQFFESLDTRMRRKRLDWWDDNVFMCVINAIENVGKEPPPCK